MAISEHSEAFPANLFRFLSFPVFAANLFDLFCARKEFGLLIRIYQQCIITCNV